MAKKDYIRASDVGFYVYCRRAWWLQRVAGFTPENEERLAAGSVAHAQHGQRVRRSQRQHQLAMLCLLIAGLLLGLLAVALIFVL